MSCCRKCKHSQCNGAFQADESSESSSDSTFDLAGIEVSRVQSTRTVLSPISCEIRDETNKVSFLSGSTKLVTEFNGWTSGQGKPETSERYCTVTNGTEVCNLPFLMTEGQFSNGCLARIMKLEEQLEQNWLQGFEILERKGRDAKPETVSPNECSK